MTDEEIAEQINKRIIEIMQKCDIIEYRICTALGEDNGKPMLYDELRFCHSYSDYYDPQSWLTANEFTGEKRTLLKELERLTMGEES